MTDIVERLRVLGNGVWCVEESFLDGRQIVKEAVDEIERLIRINADLRAEIERLRDHLTGEREQYENAIQQVTDLARERNLLKELLQSAERECEGLRAASGAPS